MTTHLSAPGKLFLVGEYAVLEGAPALLAAVDRRVRVTMQHARDAPWRISAPDIGVDELTLDADGRLPDAMDSATRARLTLFDTVRRATAEYAGRPPGPLTLRIDSHTFTHNGRKLGLGSSAAVAATLTAALTRAAGAECNRAALCRLAIAAHRRAQGGTGSGADVATSILGGVIEYRTDTVPTVLGWPAGLAGIAVMTGSGAGTPELVRRVRQYAARQPARYTNDMEHLKTLASDARAALRDPDAFMALAADYFETLQALDAGADAGIVLARHRQLARLARQYGGVFKTTGAGGGDIGLVLSHSGQPAQQLADRLAAHGARIVALKFGADGLHIG